MRPNCPGGLLGLVAVGFDWMRTRMLAVLVAVGVLASLGAGGRVLLCEMGSGGSFECPCAHAEQDDPCDAIQARCCGASDVASAPSAAWVSSDRTNPGGAVALGRAPHGDSDLWIPSRSLRPAERGLPVRAGPPIFLEICSYLS